MTSLATPAEAGARVADPLRFYLASFVVMGVAVSALGPAVTELREQVGASLGAISVLFVAQSLGYIAGSLLSGKGYDHGLGHRLYAAALVAMGVALLTVVLAPSLALLGVVFVLVGLAAGTADVGGNTLLVWSRGAAVGPAMNALHFSFGVGALLAPLLVHAGIGAAGLAAVVAGGLVAWGLLRTPTPPKLDAADHDAGEEAPAALVAAVAFFLFLYVGLEAGFGGWVHTYAEEIDLGGAWAATGLTAAFWGAFTVGRLISVWLATLVPAGTIVVGSSALAVVAAATLVLANGAAVLVWPVTVLLGLSLAPQFAGIIAFAERHMAISGKATSWFLAASSIGGLTVLFVIGQLLDAVGADALPVVMLVMAVAALAWVLVVTRLLRNRRGPALPPLATHTPLP